MESVKHQPKNVGELVKNLYGTTSKEKEPEQGTIPLSWITTLFQRFQGIWLNKWAANFPSLEIMESAKLDWQDALKGYSPAEIRLGIESARILEWAPSIGEFLLLCRPLSCAAHREYKFIDYSKESSPESRAKAEEARKQIRQQLGIQR